MFVKYRIVFVLIILCMITVACSKKEGISPQNVSTDVSKNVDKSSDYNSMQPQNKANDEKTSPILTEVLWKKKFNNKVKLSKDEEEVVSTHYRNIENYISGDATKMAQAFFVGRQGDLETRLLQTTKLFETNFDLPNYKMNLKDKKIEDVVDFKSFEVVFVKEGVAFPPNLSKYISLKFSGYIEGDILVLFLKKDKIPERQHWYAGYRKENCEWKIVSGSFK